MTKSLIHWCSCLSCAAILLAWTAEVHAKPKPSRKKTPPPSAEMTSSEAEPAADVPVVETEPAPGEPEPPPSAAIAVEPPSSPAEAAPAAPAPQTSKGESAEALRAEVTTLIDDLAAARAKAAVLGKALFKTRIVVRVQNLAGADAVLGKLIVSLDGAPVFRGDGSALRADEPRQVFEGFVAPGPHTLTLELEQRARADDTFGYALRESYRIKAPREKETDLLLVLDDDSTLARDFADDGEGEYDVRTRLRQTTREHTQR